MRSFVLVFGYWLISMMAAAEPTLKIINFTADWCPNCQILNPEIQTALTEFPTGEIALIPLDLTKAGRHATAEEKANAWYAAIQTADRHQAGYLWDWYGGITGLATIISADNGEPIACFNRLLDADAIEGRLREALIISRRRPPGRRMPGGAECPPPLN